MTELATRNLTILLTDIKGFTDKTSRKSRGEILEMLERHKAVVLPVLEGRGGKLIKTIGDAFLMVFESPTDAVLAGVAVQEALREHNKDKAEDDRLDVRVAINTGEVNLADNDIFGEPVNITARIEAVAEAGEVFFTEAVYLAMNKKEVPSSEVGLLQLKGIPEKIRVYKVKKETPVSAASAAETLPASARAASSSPHPSSAGPKLAPSVSQPVIACKALPSARRRGLALLIDVCLCGLLVGFFFSSSSRRSHHRRRDAAVKAALADGAAQAVKNAASGTIKMDDNGVRVDSRLGKVVMDDNGIMVSGGGKQLKLDDNGVTLKDANGARTLAKAGDDDGGDDEDNGGRWRWAWPMTWFVYGLVCLKWLEGTTAGGKIMKLGVVRADGSPLQKRDRFVRSAFSVLSGYCAGLGYFWGLWEKEGRGWHDLMAGTRVVTLD